MKNTSLWVVIAILGLSLWCAPCAAQDTYWVKGKETGETVKIKESGGKLKVKETGEKFKAKESRSGVKVKETGGKIETVKSRPPRQPPKTGAPAPPATPSPGEAQAAQTTAGALPPK